MIQSVIITQPRERGPNRVFDPIAPHSEYAKVNTTSLHDRNILRMEHEDGSVSMVVLGEGYTVSFVEDTDS